MMGMLMDEDAITNEIKAVTETIQAISPQHVLWAYLQDELKQLKQMLSRIKK